MVLAALPWAGGELGEGSPAEVARLMEGVEGCMVGEGGGGGGGCRALGREVAMNRVQGEGRQERGAELVSF